jgi:hypothetical protein
MQSTHRNISATLCVLGFLSIAVSSCSADDSGGPGSAGSGSGGSANGGSSALSGAPSGGTPTGGSLGTGGSTPSGGKTALPGGSAGMGGAGKGGANAAGGAGVATGGGGGTGGSQGGMGTGGTSAPVGGVAGAGGALGTGGTAGAAAGTAGATADCVEGTKGSEVAVIGDSFIAASHGITRGIEEHAKAAGALGQNEKYVDKSVSGTTLTGAIPGQYDQAMQSSGTIKYVIMDGGGNDCMGGGNGDAALQAATKLFANMAAKGTLKVEYMFYPDPLGGFASGGLKTCLDALRPKMKALCEGLTAPKCYFFDLRPVWNGHNEYTSDGIHPTAAGDKATADAVWADMVKNCVAQ